MSTEVVVCRVCGQGWQGAKVADRCPSGDGGVLIPLNAHQANPNDRMLGQVVATKYPIISKLGAGGFGAVYRGLQEPVGRPVAIKVISADAATDTNLRGRFFQEARVVSRLSDPATVTLYDYGETDDGTLFMVFELLEGKLLAELLHESRTLEPARAVGMMVQVLGACAEAHRLGLVHRDLKPENLMVCRTNLGEEKVKVLDFGIAKVLGNDGPDDVRTQKGIVLGTPRYMSPEQSQNAALDGRSDLYAVGIMLYEMLVGEAPFTSGVPLDILIAHITKPVPPIPREAGVPPALVAVVMKALEKSPAARFASAEEMARAARAALEPGATPMSVLGAQAVNGSEGRGAAQPVARPVPKAVGGARPSRPPDGTTPGPVRRAEPSGELDAPVRASGGRGGLIAVVIFLLLAAGGAGAWYFKGRMKPTRAPADDDNVKTVRMSIGDAPAPTLAAALESMKGGQREAAVLALVGALQASPDRAALAGEIRTHEALKPLLDDARLAPLLGPIP